MTGDAAVYHAGSRAVQDRVGVRANADHVGRSVGRDIKPVAAAFLGLQPLLVVGAAAPETGRVWASALTGAPGFVRATGARRIKIHPMQERDFCQDQKGGPKKHLDRSSS